MVEKKAPAKKAAAKKAAPKKAAASKAPAKKATAAAKPKPKATPKSQAEKIEPLLGTIQPVVDALPEESRKELASLVEKTIDTQTDKIKKGIFRRLFGKKS